MKVSRMFQIAGMLFLIGAMVPAYPSPDPPGAGQGKPERRGRGGEQEGMRDQQRGRPQREQNGNPNQAQPQRSRKEARAWQNQRGWQRPGTWEPRNNWRDGRARSWSFDHRTWEQRGGYGGYYIPQDRFRRHFGSQHVFRLRHRPALYLGYPRFQYAGFSFLLVDPWPEYWDEDWYVSNDFYIDFDGGYYLCNTRYPDVRLAVTVVM